MNRPNILFYSTKCPTCGSLITILKNEGLLPFFRMVCVDNKLTQIPPQIKTVPTAIITQINRPLVAKEIFEWVAQIKLLKNNQGQTQAPKLIQPITPQIAQRSNLIEFNEHEMQGTSDKYAYTTTDIALPHMYHGIGDDSKYAIFTAPEQPKINEQDQRSQIQQLTVARNEQDKGIKTLYEQQQRQKLSEYSTRT